MNMDFGTITGSVKYTNNPMRSRIVEQFNYEFGDRPGMNLFMPEEAQREAALQNGAGAKLFERV